MQAAREIGVIDNRMLLQVAILGLLEDDKLTVHEVSEIAQRAIRDVWYGLKSEGDEKT